MGIKVRLGVEGGVYHRAIANLGAALRRVAEIRLPTLQEGISFGMFASDSLPYEASKTYRTIMTEFDCTRAQTQIQTRQALWHGI